MLEKGILLINLGTPNSCGWISVVHYLKTFLSDPRVIDLPAVLRFILVNLIIIPKRFRQTQKAYQKIWEEGGSPLLVNSLNLKEKLACKLGEGYRVELAMRYGKPSMEEAVKKLDGCEKIVVIPLFPQYSSAATGSAIEHFNHEISKYWNVPEIHIKRDFYNHPGYIESYAIQIQNSLIGKKIDKLILSYHGLPERHIHKSNCRASCNKIKDCPEVDEKNSFCYRAQCFASSRLIAHALQLKESDYTVAFQSRLGRTPWIKPYTDHLLPQLIREGVKDIAIVCPSFVADCLETLEEVNMRARRQWKLLGGGEFYFIPCLNTHPTWVECVSDMAMQH